MNELQSLKASLQILHKLKTSKASKDSKSPLEFDNFNNFDASEHVEGSKDS